VTDQVEVNVLGSVLTFKTFLKYRGQGEPKFIYVSTAAVLLPEQPHQTKFSGYFTSKRAAATTIQSLAATQPEIYFTQYHPGVLADTVSCSIESGRRLN
jgi:NAD(P)-dependent dehydrogenase (short-subunit alcohol dehydrogenase family)